jgi:hypothetical protein
MANGVVVERGVRGETQTGRGIEFDQEETAPERAEGHPEATAGVEQDGGIDGVEIVVRTRADHDAAVLPAVVG